MPSVFIDFEDQLWVYLDERFHIEQDVLEPGYHRLSQCGRVKVAHIKNNDLTVLTYDGKLIQFDGYGEMTTTLSDLPNDVCNFVIGSHHILLLTESGRMMIYRNRRHYFIHPPNYCQDIENVDYIGVTVHFFNGIVTTALGYLVNDEFYLLYNDDETGFATKISEFHNVAKCMNGCTSSLVLHTDGTINRAENTPLNSDINNIADFSVGYIYTLLVNFDGEASVVNTARWAGDQLERKIPNLPQIIQVAEDSWLLDHNHNVWKISKIRMDTSEIVCEQVTQLPLIRSLSGYPCSSQMTKSSRKI